MTDEPDTPVVVLDWLAWVESLSILGSRAKSGKTTLIVDRIVAAFEAGRLRDGVLFFSEMSKGKLKRYMRTRGALPEWIKLVRWYPLLPANQIAAIVTERQPGVFVVDSLTPLVVKTFGQRARGSLWDGATVSGVLTPLRETERPGVVTHHSRKEDDRLRDSTGIEAEVDMIVTTVLDDQQSDRPRIVGLRFNGRWSDQPDERLTFAAETCAYRRDDAPDPSDDRPLPGSVAVTGQVVPYAATWLAKYLQPGESLTRAEIERRARAKKPKFNAALKVLTECGAWAATGSGKRGDPKVYAIPVPAPVPPPPGNRDRKRPGLRSHQWDREGTGKGPESGTQVPTYRGTGNGTGVRDRSPVENGTPVPLDSRGEDVSGDDVNGDGETGRADGGEPGEKQAASPPAPSAENPEIPPSAPAGESDEAAVTTAVNQVPPPPAAVPEIPEPHPPAGESDDAATSPAVDQPAAPPVEDAAPVEEAAPPVEETAPAAPSWRPWKPNMRREDPSTPAPCAYCPAPLKDGYPSPFQSRNEPEAGHVSRACRRALSDGRQPVVGRGALPAAGDGADG